MEASAASLSVSDWAVSGRTIATRFGMPFAFLRVSSRLAGPVTSSRNLKYFSTSFCALAWVAPALFTVSETDLGRCFTARGTKTLSPSETNTETAVPCAGAIRAPAGLLSTPSVGRFASSAPNAIGTSSSGSNSLNTARYISTATTPHITIIRQSTYRKPVSQARSIRLCSIICGG